MSEPAGAAVRRASPPRPDGRARRPPAAARRQGIGTALSAHAVAKQRGCTTASLQAAPTAEDVYARVGFRDLGRFDEYVPAPEPSRAPAS